MKKIFKFLLMSTVVLFLCSCANLKKNNTSNIISTTDVSKTTSNTITSSSTTKTEYVVNFWIGNDTPYLSINLEEGQKVIKPEDPTKDGYVFLGWYNTSNLITSFDFDSIITENRNVFAKWVKAVTVSFYNIDKEDMVVAQGSFIELSNPTKDGYEFMGWYKDENYLVEFDNTKAIDSDLVLYAKFVKYYNVSFREIDLNDLKIKEGSKLNISEPTKEGLTFDGWYLDDKYENKFDLNTPITKDLILYAKWIDGVIITYHNVDKENEIILKGTTIDKIDDGIKEGYTFIGWYLDNEFNNKLELPYKIDTDIDLYAKFEINVYNVEFVNTSLDNIKINYNEKITKPKDPIKDGYTFLGWYKDSSFNQNFDFDVTIKTDLKIYAKFLKNIVISFKNINKDDINTTEGYLNIDDPIKEGYEFIGWFSDELYENSVNKATYLDNDITLYAKFEILILNVHLILNGGICDNNIIKVSYGEKVNLPIPSKGDIDFIGWYQDENFNNLWDENTLIKEETYVYAKWDEVSVNILSYGGYAEGIYFNFEPFDGYSIDDYEIKYKLSTDKEYKTLDKELLRSYKTYFRFDILGLKQGQYDVLMYCDNSICLNKTNIEVNLQDRSGYAHFNYTKGVGAYNDDGTLKTGTVVVYVNEDNKNTVKATISGKTYTGISEIIKASTKSSISVDIRILGRISAATWNSLTVEKYDTATSTTVKGINNKYLELKNYDESDIISGGFNTLNTTNVSKLNGLTNKIKYDSSKKEFDSYYNMLDVSGAQNITVEGVGIDAEIFQWGFTWKGGNSIEVKNLTFKDYPEDACSFEGNGTDSNLTSIDKFTSTNYWIHNNSFEKGINYWDVCSEQDKHDGDGATDFKRVAFVTLSYNHYIKNHKTGLVGGGDTQMSASITFHHNYYQECQARLPFARQANMHMYNNYYYKSSGNNMQIYAGAYAFIENCYFDNISKTFILDERNTGKTPAIKSYNNIFNNCKNYNSATIVTSRDAYVTNGNTFGKKFDVDSSLFYYDNENKISKVNYMTDANQAKIDVLIYAGAGKLISPIEYNSNIDDIDNPIPTIEENILLYTYNFEDLKYDEADTKKYYLNSNKEIGLITIVSSSKKKSELGINSVTFLDTDNEEITLNQYFVTGGASTTDGRYIIVDLSSLDSSKNYNIEIYTRTGNNTEARTGELREDSFNGTNVKTLECPIDSVIKCNTYDKATNKKYYIMGNANIHILLIRIIQN